MTPLVAPVRLRSSEADVARRVTWLELFFDLVYVAAVAQAAAPLASDYSPAGLGRFAFLFTCIWWAWLGQTLYANRFDPDDFVQRLLTLAQIFGVAVMAINADGPLDSRSTAGFVAAYAGLRAILTVQYVRAWRVQPSRPLAVASAAGTGAAAAIWLLSAVTPPPVRFSLWVAAALAELIASVVVSRYTADVPPHPAHLPERFGLFTIILLGESLVAVMKGMQSQEEWSWPAASSALLGVTVAFVLWWWYFEGADAAGDRHVRSRPDAGRLHVWMYTHLPLYLGVVVTGVGAEHVIAFAPVGHLHAAEAWMLAGALAIAMVALTTLAATHLPRSGASPARQIIRRQRALAAVALIAGAAGPLVPPAPFLLALVGLIVLQVVMSATAGRLALAHHVSAHRDAAVTQ